MPLRVIKYGEVQVTLEVMELERREHNYCNSGKEELGFVENVLKCFILSRNII